MNRLTTLLLVLLLLAGGSFAFAKVTTKNYSGSYNGVACTVEMNWHNWSGLGPVDGQIKLANGTTISFSGSNNQSGVLELKANGKSLRLVRSDSGKKASWLGNRLSLTEGGRPTPSPSPTPIPSPTPTAEISDSNMVEEAYTGSWKGKAVTAQMRWAPGDTPDVIRRGRGMVTVEDGTQVSIEGWQPSADSAEFRLTPDETGETYKTTKASSDGKMAWESSSLTLTEKK